MNCYPKDKHYHDGFFILFLINKKKKSTHKKIDLFVVIVVVKSGGFGLRKKGYGKRVKKKTFF